MIRQQLYPATLYGLLALTVFVLLAGCSGGGADAADTDAPDAGVYQAPRQGAAINPPTELQDFTLPNQDGEPTSLSDFQGKPTLLYFGYTFCPDICPTSLADLVRVRQLLGDQANEVNVVMISVDGERDDPARLKRYLASFDDSFIGLTGDDQTLSRIGADYGLFVQKREVPGTSAEYLIDHTASIYLIDETGHLVRMYAYGTPPQVMSQELQTYLETGEFS